MCKGGGAIKPPTPNVPSQSRLNADALGVSPATVPFFAGVSDTTPGPNGHASTSDSACAPTGLAGTGAIARR